MQVSSYATRSVCLLWVRPALGAAGPGVPPRARPEVCRAEALGVAGLLEVLVVRDQAAPAGHASLQDCMRVGDRMKQNTRPDRRLASTAMHRMAFAFWILTKWPGLCLGGKTLLIIGTLGRLLTIRVPLYYSAVSLFPLLSPPSGFGLAPASGRHIGRIPALPVTSLVRVSRQMSKD